MTDITHFDSRYLSMRSWWGDLADIITASIFAPYVRQIVKGL